MALVHADHAFAARIERSVMRDLVLLAEMCARLEPTMSPSWIEIAGGVALYLAPGSPVNSIYGAGMAGAVAPDALETAERFYRERGAHPAISLCPLANRSLVEQLTARGWLVADFENVLALPLVATGAAATPPPTFSDVTMREASSLEDRGEWARISSRAYAAPDEPSQEQVRLGEAMAAREDFALLIGAVDGQDAGAGALWLDDGLGWLLGDATLPDLRRRGVQSALQSKRCQLAREAGCELAVTEAQPGSGSQRNMERQGFRVVYTRVEMLAPLR